MRFLKWLLRGKAGLSKGDAESAPSDFEDDQCWLRTMKKLEGSIPSDIEIGFGVPR